MHSDSSSTIADLRALVARFVAERQWQPFHDPKNLAMSIAIEAAELMEHFQWLRSDQLDDAVRENALREELCDEMADIACYLLALSNRLDVDLAAAVERKMEKNARKYPADQVQGHYRKPARDR